MHVVDVVIFAGWLAFWIYWLAAAIGVKSGHTGWTRFAGFRVGIILVVLLLVRTRVFKGHAVISDPWLQGIGLAVFGLRGGRAGLMGHEGMRWAGTGRGHGAGRSAEWAGTSCATASISYRDGRVPPVTASRPAVRPAAAGNPHGQTAASRPGRSRRPRSPDP